MAAEAYGQQGEEPVPDGAIDPPGAAGSVAPRTAYIVSRFPKITETFISDEITRLQGLGLPIEVFSLVPTEESQVHPRAAALLPRVHFGARNPGRLLLAQLRWISSAPRLVLALWAQVLRGNWGSLGLLLKSVVTMLVACDWATRMRAAGIQRLHAHWATHPALAAYVISRLNGVPYGFTGHAHDLYAENGMLEEKIQAADLVVTISDFNARLLRERFGTVADKVRVLHCGIETDVFRPSAARPGPLATVNLLCVAGLRDYKGHRHLLEALQRVRSANVDFRCTLVGDGPLRADLTDLARRLGLSTQVVFLGRRISAEVRALIEDCDAFVLPSVQAADGTMEGIPVALMEALGAGRPVIASHLSGIPELVDSSVGLLVPPGDSAALAAAIRQLATDDTLRLRLGAAGPARVQQGFDQDENVRILYDWLRE